MTIHMKAIERMSGYPIVWLEDSITEEVFILDEGDGDYLLCDIYSDPWWEVYFQNCHNRIRTECDTWLHTHIGIKCKNWMPSIKLHIRTNKEIDNAEPHSSS